MATRRRAARLHGPASGGADSWPTFSRSQAMCRIVPVRTRSWQRSRSRRSPRPGLISCSTSAKMCSSARTCWRAIRPGSVALRRLAAASAGAGASPWTSWPPVTSTCATSERATAAGCSRRASTDSAASRCGAAATWAATALTAVPRPRRSRSTARCTTDRTTTARRSPTTAAPARRSGAATACPTRSSHSPRSTRCRAWLSSRTSSRLRRRSRTAIRWLSARCVDSQ